jgi:hypothetical protein
MLTSQTAAQPKTKQSCRKLTAVHELMLKREPGNKQSNAEQMLKRCWKLKLYHCNELPLTLQHD